MADLIACPVCTLYLHKGMSLAEHLDTHPKEQVIRALVSFASIEIPTTKLETPSTTRSPSPPPPSPPLPTIKSAATSKSSTSPPTTDIKTPCTVNSATSNNFSSSKSILPCSSVDGPTTPDGDGNCVNSSNLSRQQQQIQPTNNSVEIRQSALVYQIPEGRPINNIQNGSTLIINNNPATHLQDQFNLTNKPTKKLPPPPAYGTAITQLRSQNNQSNYCRTTTCGPTTSVLSNNCGGINFYGTLDYSLPKQSTSTSNSQPPRYQKQPTTAHFSIDTALKVPPQKSSTINATASVSGSGSGSMLNIPCRTPSPICLIASSLSPRQAPSPSVLRFAESPVSAQYVERDNGEFIVQESPRHIVQCFEKDDGEFSVIEKVIRSPPGLVQIDEFNENDSLFTTPNLDADSEVVAKEPVVESTKNTTSIIKIEDSEPKNRDTPIFIPKKVSHDPCSSSSLDKQKPTTSRKNSPGNVKVLSNVKLDPNESLDIMENINKIGSERFWTGIVQSIKKEDVDLKVWNISTPIDKIDNQCGNLENKKNKIDEQEASCSSSFVTVTTESNPGSAATTSVIRLASHYPTRNENSPSKATTSTSTARDLIKKPYKKHPKKLVVKFKNPPIPKSSHNNADEVIEVIDLDEPTPKQSYRAEMPISKTELVVSTSINNQDESPQNNTEVVVLESTQIANETADNDKINIILDMHETVFSVTEITESDYKMDIGCAIFQATEAPNSLTSPEFIKKDVTANAIEADVKNAIGIKEEEEKKLAQEINTCTFLKIDKDVAAENEPLSGILLLNSGNDLGKPDGFGSRSESIDIAPESLNSIISTSSLQLACSKPSTSSFAIREIQETDLQQQQSTPSHHHNTYDYPFSFLYSAGNNGASNTVTIEQQHVVSDASSSNSSHPISKSNLSPVYHQHSTASDLFTAHHYSGPIFHSNSNLQDLEDEKSSYLDLDACSKAVTSCSASSSIGGSSGSRARSTNTQNHIPLGEALNIRTDEKMPAKGEISEQESNGDIENSWSQPLYTEMAYKFPNPYDHFVSRESWSLSHDDFFVPHDLSTSGRSKSIPEKRHAPGTSSEVTTSTAGKKKKKLKKSTVLSAAAAAGAAAATTTTATDVAMPPLPRSTNIPAITKRRVYKCEHCSRIFLKLKDRSHHLIEEHQYKRVKRRLIRQIPSSTVTSASIISQYSSLTQPKIEPIDSTDGTVQNNIKIEDSVAMLGEPTLTLEIVNESEDKKPIVAVVATSSDSMGYPKTKFDSIRAGVYRMLMNFNLSVLQQKGGIDVDEKSLFESKSFCCYTCKRDFISVKLFDEHLSEHAAECFTCGKKFSRWTYFSLHLKRHLGWKDFWCTICDKKFVIRSALIEHVRTHTGAAPLKCNICTKSFKRYSNLTQHKKICHNNRPIRKKEYVCFCGEVLPSKARFLWHKEIHDAKPKCCPWCRDRFVHANSLRRHIRLTHSDKFAYSEPAECTICNQIYAKSSLKGHMATHSLDTQHECPICNKSFSTKWNLKIHSWVHANRTAKPFKCEHCTKAFVREVDYKNHMNAHKQIRPYTCEYCGCKFIRKYNYMRHRREHHGQKKFSCDLCSKLFHRHYYLIEHRRIHTGERPFLCTICGKSSTTKTNHNKHLKIHHSRDPFTSES